MVPPEEIEIRVKNKEEKNGGKIREKGGGVQKIKKN